MTTPDRTATTPNAAKTAVPAWACLACRDNEARHEAEWLAAPCARHRREALSTGADTPGDDPHFVARRRALLNATAGVALTERDVRLLNWLAGWEDETTDALADLIDRARTALVGPIL